MTISGILVASKHIIHISVAVAALTSVLVDYFDLAPRIESRLKSIRQRFERVRELVFEGKIIDSLAAILAYLGGVVYAGVWLWYWIIYLRATDLHGWVTWVTTILFRVLIGCVVIAVLGALAIWIAVWLAFLPLMFVFLFAELVFHLMSLPRKGVVATVGLLLAAADVFLVLHS